MTLIRPDGSEGGTHDLHDGVNKIGRNHGAIFESVERGEVDRGVVIMDVAVGSSASELGFQAGDIIVQVGRYEVSDVDVLERLLGRRQRVWFVAVRRGSKVLRLEVPG